MTTLDTTMLDPDVLKQLRTRAGLTQQALAVNAGLSIAQIVAMEQGSRTNPRLDTLRKLAAGLRCTVAELIGEVPVKPGRKPKKEG